MLTKRNNPVYLIKLSSEIEISRLESFSRSEIYFEESRPGTLYFEVPDLKSAKELCFEFIKHYNLSSSNWSGGLILNEQHEFVAKVSYNGRVWDNQDWKIANEIELC